LRMGNDTQRLLVGEFAGVHGVQGELKLRSFTEDPEAIFSYTPLSDASGERIFSLTRTGRAGVAWRVRLAGVHSREDAQALARTAIYAPREVVLAAGETLDEDDFFVEDLKGLRALDASGVELGRVKQVMNYGAGDIVELQGAQGASLLYPFTRAIFPQVCVAEGWLRCLPPETVTAEQEKNSQSKT
jgi:16S rRNA processing protein RimM